MLDLSTFTEDQLNDLAVAIDRQRAAGVGQPTAPAHVPACNVEQLQRALCEIEEHNSEKSYWTGQRVINELRVAAGMEPGPVYNERSAESNYGR